MVGLSGDSAAQGAWNTRRGLTTPKLFGARIMADSDHSTTLPFVTRRPEPIGSNGLGDTQALGAQASDSRPITDPALVLSLAWIEAHTTTLASCVRQQEAETEVIRDGGFASVSTEVPRNREGTTAELRYVAARKVELENALKAETLLEKIAATPAISLAGVIAKLSVVVREATDNSDLSDFPLPHIRSALADLRSLADETIGDDVAVLPGFDQSIGSLFEKPASAIAAWRAFCAWSQGDDETYRTWTDTFRTLQSARQ